MNITPATHFHRAVRLGFSGAKKILFQRNTEDTSPWLVKEQNLIIEAQKSTGQTGFFWPDKKSKRPFFYALNDDSPSLGVPKRVKNHTDRAYYKIIKAATLFIDPLTPDLRKVLGRRQLQLFTKRIQVALENEKPQIIRVTIENADTKQPTVTFSE
jgi:hypothetical protein